MSYRQERNRQADWELAGYLRAAESGEELVIVSGEGVNGHVREYGGRLTMRALKMRLTRERCEGDRWARVMLRREVMP